MKARSVAVALLAGVAMLAGTTDAEAARLYRWKDRYGVTQYGDQPPARDELPASDVNVIRFRNPPGALVRLRLENKGGRYQAWADNLLHGPVEVMLRFKHHRNVYGSPALPAEATVPARSSVLVVITHQVNITALSGVFPAPGEAVVLNVRDADLPLLGRIRPAP